MRNTKHALVALALSMILSACNTHKDAEVIDESKSHDHPAGIEHSVADETKPTEAHNMGDMMKMLEGKTGMRLTRHLLQ